MAKPEIITSQEFPLAYRWFIVKGIENLQPWYFTDDIESISRPPDLAKGQHFQDEFKIETGADFDVYLFARRQDTDDFAFFAMKDGKLLDRVIPIHLSFCGKFDPYLRAEIKNLSLNFMDWFKLDVIEDIRDWQSEADLVDTE